MTGDERRRNPHEQDTAARGGDAPPTREYSTDRITVQWHAGRCIHSENCVRALPGVFDFRRRPWVDVHAADADAIERAVLRCPSGALRSIRHDGGSPDPPAETPLT
jgi:uncharacterized Fe-S cluster protein YjdI